MISPDIRWKQRFANYQKALALLTSALAIPQPDITQQAGLIQFFEVSFELAWKTMKDYLESEGFTELKSPRDTIKKAFEISLIKDGRLWLYALENRNVTAHVYDEEKALEVHHLIAKDYAPMLKELASELSKKSIK